jgi:hypothetical protein
MAISINKFAVILIALVFTVTILSMIYKMLRGANWKTILEFLRAVLIISMIISGFTFLIMLLPRSSNSAPVEVLQLPPEPPITAPLGRVPPLLLWLVGMSLLAVSVLVGVWIWTPSRRRPIDLVGLEAEKAWQALQIGVDLRDVIITCYRQMSLALKKERGIEREDSMTTGEFEKFLQAAGVPDEPIHQLTRLFDAVRYGNWQPNLADKQQAIQCLEAIVFYSRTTRGTN